MESKKVVSIIVPCYNAEKYLDRFFRSVLGQTYRDLELIIVNDGSTDHSDEMIREYAKQFCDGRNIKYISYEVNQGQAFALNEGLKEITGDYITWIDADDEMTDDCIEKKAGFLEKHPEFDYCVTDSCMCDGVTGKEIRTTKPVQFDDRISLFESFIYGKNAYYVCGAYMMRRSFFDEHFKEGIYCGRGGQNAQMLLPCAWFGNRGYLPETLYYYYNYDSSHSHSMLTPEKQIRQLYDFEKILLATIEKMNIAEGDKYSDIVRKKLARDKFGHALDTYNADLIRKTAGELKHLGIIKAHDIYLVIRYTSRLLKLIIPVKR